MLGDVGQREIISEKKVLEGGNGEGNQYANGQARVAGALISSWRLVMIPAMPAANA
jgi:hypothetical protein